ncbi:MAG: radical SAM family heme chaperone HemW [Micrococcales bacterium]
MSTFHAYVHIPFCSVRCGYCDFNTYTASELRGIEQRTFAQVIAQEIDASYETVGKRELHSVFFGGGTPTQLPASDLVYLLTELHSKFSLAANAEVTTEANPDNVTLEYLQELKAGGFTRISFGMQSAVDRVLKLLDRTHDASRLPLVINWAKEAGLQVSVDLIYGTPTESLEEWETSVRAAIELQVDHISAYSLIVEPGTAMARKIKSGQLPAVDEDLHATMYEMADALLAEAGFEWYEVSNWSKSTETRSKHNLAYWDSQDWWGYGPGAHSHLANRRWWNLKHPATYAAALASGKSLEAGSEMLSTSDLETERVMLQLRISSGLAVESIKQLSGYSPKLKASFIADGLVDGVQAIRGQLVLTLKGRLLADGLVRQILG